MSSFLALDTSTSACSVALSYRGEVVSDFDLADKSHTLKLLPMVDRLLGEVGVTLQQLDAITFTNGPGSFTGIRIGFAAVQGLAMASELPVIAVSTLHLLAATATRRLNLGIGTDIYTALDARMGELYLGHYAVADARIEARMEDKLLPPEKAFAHQAGTVLRGVGVGEGWALLKECIVADEIQATALPDAVDLLPIAGMQLAAGNILDVRNVQPLYLRDTVSWKKRQWLRPR